MSSSVGDISLANGLTGTVITPPNVTEFTGDTFTMDFLPDLINQPFEKVICDYQYFKADPKLRPALKNNPYNFGNKFELAYALTAHNNNKYLRYSGSISSLFIVNGSTVNGVIGVY